MTVAGLQASARRRAAQRLVRTCLQTANDAKAELGRRQAASARARSDAERAGAALADLAATVTRTAAELADHAARAGISWQPADAEASSLVQRASARVTVRLENVRAVRAADAVHRTSAHARDLARIALDRARQALTEAEQAEESAAVAVTRAMEAARQALADWSSRYAGLLPAAEWADLTEALREALANRTPRCRRARITAKSRPRSSTFATGRRPCAPTGLLFPRSGPR